MLPSFSFFKPKPKTPHELVKLLKEAHGKLNSSDLRSIEKSTEDCTKYYASIKTIACGDGLNGEANVELLAQLAQEAYNAGLLQMIITNLGRYEFEARKDAVQIFNALVRRQIGMRNPTIEYICNHEEILKQLINGYERAELALNFGLMLRECIRHETLAQQILHSPEFYTLFDYVQLPTFDIASDAFATLKDLLTKHKMLVASFLITNYDELFAKYNLLLQSENYVTRRQSLKLLGEMLLDRANFDVMTRYISNAENLKTLMNLLRDKSKNIQYEAFHVFKIFVANPNKGKPIYDILLKNQRKLLEFFEVFQAPKEDEQFLEEKRFLSDQLRDLTPPQLPPTPTLQPTITQEDVEHCQQPA